MVRLKNPWASVRFVSLLAVGGLALSGCATTDYVDQQIATVNGRIDAVDAKATDAIQRADAANSAAQAAAGDARNAISHGWAGPNYTSVKRAIHPVIPIGCSGCYLCLACDLAECSNSFS